MNNDMLNPCIFVCEGEGEHLPIKVYLQVLCRVIKITIVVETEILYGANNINQ